MQQRIEVGHEVLNLTLGDRLGQRLEYPLGDPARHGLVDT
jgi:hypothetical protein